MKKYCRLVTDLSELKVGDRIMFTDIVNLKFVKRIGYVQGFASTNDLYIDMRNRKIRKDKSLRFWASVLDGQWMLLFSSMLSYGVWVTNMTTKKATAYVEARQRRGLRWEFDKSIGKLVIRNIM